jgi:hypothetical protein
LAAWLFNWILIVSVSQWIERVVGFIIMSEIIMQLLSLSSLCVTYVCLSSGKSARQPCSFQSFNYFMAKVKKKKKEKGKAVSVPPCRCQGGEEV